MAQNPFKSFPAISRSRNDEDPTNIPAFKIHVINYDNNGDIDGTREIEWDDNEIEIHTRYGAEPSYADIHLYLNDPNMNNNLESTIRVGDPIMIEIYDLVMVGERIILKIKSVSYESGDNGWYLNINAEIPAYFYTSIIRPDFSIEFPGGANIGSVFSNIIATTWDRYRFDETLLPRIFMDDFTDFSKKMEYSHVFSTNIPLNKLMDRMVQENNIEWYFNIYDNAICIGEMAPLSSDAIEGFDERVGKFPGNIMYYSIGQLTGNEEVKVGTSILPGDPYMMCGMGFQMNDGQVWKIVKSVYYLKSDGESESQTWMLPAKTVCDKDMMDIIDDIKFGDVDDNYNDIVKVMDVSLALGEESGKDIGDYYSSDDNFGNYLPRNRTTQDPRKLNLYKALLHNKILFSTPFAGDGVGLKFPIQDNSRFITVSPIGLHNHAVATMMMWKKEMARGDGNDDIIPECNSKDFYLRMHKGYLYFDEECEHWCLKSANILLSTEELEGPTEKPDPEYPDADSVKIGLSRDPKIIFLDANAYTGITIVEDDNSKKGVILISVVANHDIRLDEDAKTTIIRTGTDQSIEMENGGNIVIKNGSNTITIKSGEIEIEASTIKIGSGASTAVVINGDDVNVDSNFVTWLNSHVHPAPGSPPATPFIGPKIGTSLASTTKAKAE